MQLGNHEGARKDYKCLQGLCVLGCILGMSGRIVRTEMLAGSRILYYAGSTSGNDMELGFSFYIFVSVRVADREFVTTFSAACGKNLPTSYGEGAGKESMCSKSFSFLEFSEHSACVI